MMRLIVLFCFGYYLFKAQDVGAEIDAFTFFPTPATHYGRLFPLIVEKHQETDVSVVSPVLLYLLV